MLGVTFQAVSKVIVAVLVGAFCCGSIPNSTTTMRDFSFLISNVLLPALTITNTAKSVDVEVLIRCSILLFFGVLVIFIGIGSAIVMAHLLFRVNKTHTGIPAELDKDVRLDLLYDEAPEEPTTNTNARKKKNKKTVGTPYVAVVLSPKLREMGVGGHDIVAALEVPGIEVEEFPFYYWGAWVACSIQNTVTLPLSLLQNLAESVPWLDFSEGTAYIFVFSITASLYIWACGPMYVEKAQKESIKRRLIREIVTKHNKMQERVDSTTQTDISYTAAHDVLAGGTLRDPVLVTPTYTCHHHRGARLAEEEEGEAYHGKDAQSLLSGVKATTAVPVSSAPSRGDGHSSTSATVRATSPPPPPALPLEPGLVDYGQQTELQPWSPNTAGRFHFPDIGGAEQIPYDWERAGYIRVKYADQLREVGGPSTAEKLAHSAKQLGLRLATNIPFMSIVVGIFIGVIPPIRGLFYDGGVLEMITDAVTLVGQGNIPASLLLLGANLVGSSAVSNAGPECVRMRDSEQNTDFPLVPSNDAELLGEAGRYAEWYNINHEQIEFDEHASFSLQSVLQQQAAERIAAARAAAAASEAARAKAASAAAAAEEGGEDDGSGSGGSDDSATATGKEKKKEMTSAVEAVNAGSLVPADGADTETPEVPGGFLAEVNRALSLDGVKRKFVWGVIIERLIITPAASFVVLMAMIKAMPFIFGGRGNMDRTLLVVLFMELAAPTAINSALLFNQREYMTYQWAKMLFFQYILCTATMVMWTTIGLEFVERYT